MDIDVKEHERLSNITQIKVLEQHFHCCFKYEIYDI